MTTVKEEAQNLLDSRLAVYGERVENMTRVAQVFSGILGFEVRPDQVPLLMVGYKTVRASQTPDYEDNVKDIEGYSLMFREIIGDDMIAAVNTDEYLLEKSRREMAEMQGPSVPAFLCRGCGQTLPATEPSAHRHAADCPVEELNRHTRAYNSRYEKEVPELTGAQLTGSPYTEARTTPARVERLQKEVPSYQPGPAQNNAAVLQHLGVYRQQLTDIFKRAWREQGPTVPVPGYAEAAAREAVEYFWTTFKRNEQFEAAVRECDSL
jgi:hypothetical protein